MYCVWSYKNKTTKQCACIISTTAQHWRPDHSNMGNVDRCGVMIIARVYVGVDTFIV